MNFKTSILFLAIAINFSTSATSKAGDLHIQTGRMNIERHQNGSTYIDTGRMQLSVPRNRSRFRKYPSINSYPRSTYHGCGGGHVIHQSSQQISQSGRTSSHSSTSHYRCP